MPGSSRQRSPELRQFMTEDVVNRRETLGERTVDGYQIQTEPE
jgi:hypothetical protein